MIHLSDANLTTRVSRLLRDLGVETLDEIGLLSERDFRGAYGLGRKAYNEICEVCRENGLPGPIPLPRRPVLEPKPQRSPNAERNGEMRRLRAEGLTLKALGERYGVTGGAVRAILIRTEQRMAAGVE